MFTLYLILGFSILFFVLIMTVLVLRKKHSNFKELWDCFLEIREKRNQEEKDGI